MSLVQLLPAAVMVLGEVVLHVGDVSESGSRGLLFHQGFESAQIQIPSRDRRDGKKKGKEKWTYSVCQVQRRRLVLKRDAPVQARFCQCLSAETRDILWRRSECNPLRRVERARKDIGKVRLWLL